jgi:hypothetical protein
VIAGARTARRAPVDAPVAVVTPIATVKQIMKGIVAPAAMAVFNSVSTIGHGQGDRGEGAGTDAEEWEALGNSAAALIRVRQPLAHGRPRVDKGDWLKHSQDLIESGRPR